MTTLAPEPVLADSDDGDDVAHFWCCNPKLAWCGKPIEDASLDDPYNMSDDPDDCPLCVLVKEQGGPECCVPL